MADDDLLYVLMSLILAIGRVKDAVHLVEVKGDMRPDERRQRLTECLEFAQAELNGAAETIMEAYRDSLADSQPSC